MVDKKVSVTVITDQLNSDHLDKKTEIRIRKLLKNSKTITKQQAGYLQSIIDESIQTLGKIGSAEEAKIFAAINIFTTTKATEKLVGYQDNIGKMFNYGIRFTNTTPSKLVSQLEESVKQSSMQYITKMGEDLKASAGQIVADGIKGQLPVNDIVTQLTRELDITRARANTIARTETMRAAHAGSYGQAIRDGNQYYIVDARAEACDICQDEYVGEVFDINDAASMPPLHPNCACIPVYFNSRDDAERWGNMVASEIADERQAIEDSGKTINPDGTGSETNKVDSTDRRHN